MHCSDRVKADAAGGQCGLYWRENNGHECEAMLWTCSGLQGKMEVPEVAYWVCGLQTSFRISFTTLISHRPQALSNSE